MFLLVIKTDIYSYWKEFSWFKYVFVHYKETETLYILQPKICYHTLLVEKWNNGYGYIIEPILYRNKDSQYVHTKAVEQSPPVSALFFQYGWINTGFIT